MFKKIGLLMLVLLCILNLQACISQYGIQGPPLNSRKLKKKIAPPWDFSQALMAYRKQYGYWPKSELDFQAYNSPVVQKLYLADFTDWYLGSDNSDSLYVHLEHIPVSEGAHIGGVPLPTNTVKTKTLYIYSKGIIKTKLKKKSE
tara:strand:- start:1255 stop:1689 length:435 start_codon:yes stop_codon:yes gene_type:complete